MKSMSDKILNERRNGVLRLNVMNLMSSYVDELRESPELDALPDEVVVATYAVRIADQKDWSLFYNQVDGLGLFDTETNVSKATAIGVLRLRHAGEGIEVDAPDGVNPDEVRLLSVSEISGVRTLTASVNKADRTPLASGYSISTFFADGSTSYVLVNEQGVAQYTLSSHELPIPSYLNCAPVPESELVAGIIRKGRPVSLDITDGGPLVHLGNLFTTLTASDTDLRFFV